MRLKLTMQKNKLFFSSKNLKVALIVTTGRSGSDYLNCCLDGLNGLMSFCGKFNYHQFFLQKNSKINKLILINKFLKKYGSLFSYNKIENINTKINIKKFKSNFLKITSNSKIDRKEFLINLYVAYHLTLNKNFRNIKYLIHHSHGINETINVLQDFPNSKLLITIRQPLANLKSGINNWFSYDKRRISVAHTFTYIYRIRQDLKYLITLKNKKLFVKLEEANLLKVKKNICKFLSIKLQKNIYKATLAGKVWHGDRLSRVKSKKGEYLSSTNNNKWENYFSKKEITLLSFIYNDYQKFGYKLKNLKFFEKIKCFVTIFSLFSFEKKAFQNNNLLKSLVNVKVWRNKKEITKKIKLEKLETSSDFKEEKKNIKYLIFRIIYFILIFLKLDYLLKNKHLS